MQIKHPMQPIVFAEDGCIRFKENKIVRFLLNSGPHDLNKIATMDFSKDDYQQLMQLIGYSVSGYGDLSSVSKSSIKTADAIADKMWKMKHGKKS